MLQPFETDKRLWALTPEQDFYYSKRSLATLTSLAVPDTAERNAREHL